MSRRASTALAFAAVLLWLALEAAGLTFLAHTWNTPPGDFGDRPATSIFASVISGAFASVGLLLASRRPRNAIGWIFLAITLSMASQFALGRYALHALIMTVWIAASPEKTFRSANPMFQIARGALLAFSSDGLCRTAPHAGGRAHARDRHLVRARLA